MTGVELKFDDILNASSPDLSGIKAGEVVALIGNFNPASIKALLYLFSIGAIVVPLTVDTDSDHEYFFDAALVDVVVSEDGLTRRIHDERKSLIDGLKDTGNSGLVLFSSGTTGRPKAILHDMKKFLVRFDTPRPPLKAINFPSFLTILEALTLYCTIYLTAVRSWRQLIVRLKLS